MIMFKKFQRVCRAFLNTAFSTALDFMYDSKQDKSSNYLLFSFTQDETLFSLYLAEKHRFNVDSSD